MTKTKILNIRVSIDEFKKLNQKAKDNNMNISTYTRERLFFDIPNIEKYSFEYKVLKGISYLVGAIRVKTVDQKEEIIEEAKRIMQINGIEVD